MRYVKLNGPIIMRMVILGMWLVALAAAIAIIGLDNVLSSYSHVTPQGIRDRVSQFGALAPLAFVLASLARPAFFLPVTPFTIASGVLFGFWQGMVWSLTGSTLSAILTFFVSRYLIRGYVARRFSGRFQHLDRALREHGWSYVAFVRLIPVVPFDLVGFAAGASGIRFRDYMIGTVLGELPGAVVLVMLGASLDDIGSATFYLSLALAVLVLIGPEIVRRWMKKRDRELRGSGSPQRFHEGTEFHTEARGATEDDTEVR